MGQVFFPSYLIGLREGLEMVLVVSVLVAYLVKTGRRQHLLPVWGGVAAAVVLSVGFGAALSYVSTTVLGGPGQELFDAITSVIAVALVTWMIFWMRRTARQLSGQLRGRLDDAAGLGLGAVVGIAFASVVREGLETTLLFFASAQGAVTATPLLGLAAGLGTAVLLGVGIYAGAVSIDLSRFFTVSGVLLIFVAAGIFKYGVHDFQEAGVLPGLTTYAYDASGWLDPGSWYGAVLDGVFHISARPTVLEMVAYVAYLVPVLILFLLPGRTAGPATAAPTSTSGSAPAASSTTARPAPSFPASSTTATPTTAAATSTPESPQHVDARP